MILNIKEQRIDFHEVLRYHTYKWPLEDGKIQKGRLSIYYKHTDIHTEIDFSTDELDAIVEYLDKELNVRKLTFTPEKEIIKAQLIVK